MRNPNEKSTPTYLTRGYTELCGIDMSGDCKNSFAYLENMYVDYESGANGVESIPGYHRILSLNKPLNSIAIGGVGEDKYLLIHAADQLYRLSKKEREMVNSISPIAKIIDRKSRIFAFGRLVFIADGVNLLRLTDDEIETISSDSAHAECTLGALFDNRLFLGGNPNSPSTVYYSNPIADGRVEFPSENKINLSSTDSAISALLAYENRLWIFASEDLGAGSIVLLKRRGDSYFPETSIYAPRCLSNAVAYNNRIFYMSDEGVMQIENPCDAVDRRIECRSMPIQPMISLENKKSAELNVWSGYIAVSFGERVYLADTRHRSGEIKWYFLNSIGGYRGDRRVYRYLSHSDSDYKIHKNPGKAAEGEVISIKPEDGEMIYYSSEGENRYAVYPTEERHGGEFIPAARYLSDGTLMWFATEDSNVYIFNKKDQSYNESDEMGAKMNYYAFDNHASRHVALTHKDDCGLISQEKASVPDSLRIELTANTSGDLTLSFIADDRIRDERKIKPRQEDSPIPIYNSAISYANRDCIACISEKPFGWNKRQLLFTNNDYNASFGIKSISFGYRIKQ